MEETSENNKLLSKYMKDDIEISPEQREILESNRLNKEKYIKMLRDQKESRIL